MLAPRDRVCNAERDRVYARSVLGTGSSHPCVWAQIQRCSAYAPARKPRPPVRRHQECQRTVASGDFGGGGESVPTRPLLDQTGEALGSASAGSKPSPTSGCPRRAQGCGCRLRARECCNAYSMMSCSVTSSGWTFSEESRSYPAGIARRHRTDAAARSRSNA